MIKTCWPWLTARYRDASLDTRRWALVYTPTLFLISVFVALSWLGLAMANNTFGKKDLEIMVTWFGALLFLEVLLLAHVALCRKAAVAPARIPRLLATTSDPSAAIRGTRPSELRRDLQPAPNAPPIMKVEVGATPNVVPEIPKSVLYQHPYGPDAHTEHDYIDHGLPATASADDKGNMPSPQQPPRRMETPIMHRDWLYPAITNQSALDLPARAPNLRDSSPSTLSHMPAATEIPNHLSWDLSMEDGRGHNPKAASIAICVPLLGPTPRTREEDSSMHPAATPNLNAADGNGISATVVNPHKPTSNVSNVLPRSQNPTTTPKPSAQPIANSTFRSDIPVARNNGGSGSGGGIPPLRRNVPSESARQQQHQHQQGQQHPGLTKVKGQIHATSPRLDRQDIDMKPKPRVRSDLMELGEVLGAGTGTGTGTGPGTRL